MKVKELIEQLMCCESDSDVLVSFYHGEDYVEATEEEIDYVQPEDAKVCLLIGWVS